MAVTVVWGHPLRTSAKNTVKIDPHPLDRFCLHWAVPPTPLADFRKRGFNAVHHILYTESCKCWSFEIINTSRKSHFQVQLASCLKTRRRKRFRNTNSVFSNKTPPTTFYMHQNKPHSCAADFLSRREEVTCNCNVPWQAVWSKRQPSEQTVLLWWTWCHPRRGLNQPSTFRWWSHYKHVAAWESCHWYPMFTITVIIYFHIQ